MQGALQVIVEVVDDSASMVVIGDVDDATLHQFRLELQRAVSMAKRRLIVDFSSTNYLCKMVSTLLQVADRDLKKASAELCLVHGDASEHLFERLKLINVIHDFKNYDSLGAALWNIEEPLAATA